MSVEIDAAKIWLRDLFLIDNIVNGTSPPHKDGFEQPSMGFGGYVTLALTLTLTLTLP